MEIFLDSLIQSREVSPSAYNQTRARLQQMWDRIPNKQGYGSLAYAYVSESDFASALDNSYSSYSQSHSNPWSPRGASIAPATYSASPSGGVSLGSIFDSANHSPQHGHSHQSYGPSNPYGGDHHGQHNSHGPPGSRANPLLVEVSPAKPSFLQVLLRLSSFAILAYVLYRLVTVTTGGSPFPNLTGDASEPVTETPVTRFDDVKGVDEAKAELQDVVEFLRDPEKYKKLGAKIPRGVLLTGPPGTGKTLLARAVAGEAGCKFYSKSASEFEEMLVGLGAKRVRDLFAAAQKSSPSIIFIDEIDALGGKRKVSIGSGSERQTLNQLLSCMDGFSKNENVIVIGATNSPEILDPALTRPGRFDSTVDVPLPDVRGREELIEFYLKKVVAAKDIDPVLLAKATPGFSGAQIEALINSAALMAANRNSDLIEMCDIEEARDKLIMGPAKKSRVKKESVMRLTAYHEGGHTLVALLTPGADPLHKVTILPRGFSGGATYSLPKDDEMLTKETILAQIDVCMGGRAAEELIYGPEMVTTGAGMDMRQASDLARRFCIAYSMSELGLSSFAGGNYEPSPEKKAEVDAEVEKILRASYARVVDLMKSNRDKLDRLATALLEHETLDADECKAIIDGKKILSLEEKVQLAKKQKEERMAKKKERDATAHAKSREKAEAAREARAKVALTIGQEQPKAAKPAAEADTEAAPTLSSFMNKMVTKIKESSPITVTPVKKYYKRDKDGNVVEVTEEEYLEAMQKVRKMREGKVPQADSKDRSDSEDDN